MADEMGARPGDEPTINESGAGGFAVDGTDSFAVPGPLDAADDTELGDGEVPLADGRRRLFVTLGAAAVVLLAVVVVGRAGDEDDASQVVDESTGLTYLSPFTDGGTPEVASAGWFAIDLDAVPPPDGYQYDDDLLDEYAGTADPWDTSAGSYAADDEYTVPTYDYSYDDFDLDIDDYTYRTLPRSRVIPPLTTRPRVTPRPQTTTATTTATTTPTTPATTATTVPTTVPTTPETTASTAPASSTSVPAAPQWEPASPGTLTCATGARVFVGSTSIVAVTDTEGHRSTDGGVTWTPLAVPAVTAYADGATGEQWIGTAGGVTRDGTAVGDLRNVTSLAVGSAPVVVADGVVLRLAGSTWEPVTLPGTVTPVPGALVARDDGSVLVGTDRGVLRISGSDVVPLSHVAVVGRPSRGATSVSWLRADRTGALGISTADDSASETAITGIAADASTLAEVDGALVTTSATGLVGVAAFAPQPPYAPQGVATYGDATFVWGTCTAGERIAPIMRLPG